MHVKICRLIALMNWWLKVSISALINVFYVERYKSEHTMIDLPQTLQFSVMSFSLMVSLCLSCNSPRESGVSESTPACWESAQGANDKVWKCIKHGRLLRLWLLHLHQLLQLCPLLWLHWLRSTMSTPSVSLKINGMSSLFTSYSELDRMIWCMLFYHVYLDLSVNCKYLVSLWIWLYASMFLA
jgi:hypothetical protein